MNYTAAVKSYLETAEDLSGTYSHHFSDKINASLGTFRKKLKSEGAVFKDLKSDEHDRRLRLALDDDPDMYREVAAIFIVIISVLVLKITY